MITESDQRTAEELRARLLAPIKAPARFPWHEVTQASTIGSRWMY